MARPTGQRVSRIDNGHVVIDRATGRVISGGPPPQAQEPSKGRSLSPEELQAAGMATTRELPAGYSRPRRRAQDWSPRARAAKG